MITLFGKIDPNDYEHIKKISGKEPRFAFPAPCIKKNGKYEQINPHETRFLMEDGKWASVFHIKPIYYAHLDGTWRPLSEVASYFGNKRGMTLKEGWENKMDMGYLAWYIKRLESMKSQYGVAVSYPQTFAGIELTPVQIPVLLNVDNITVYPDPSVEVNTVDGRATEQTDADWATIIAAGGDAANDNSNQAAVLGIEATTTENVWSELTRSIFLFNISSIPGGNTISLSTFSVKGYAKGDDFSATPSVNVYSSAPASNTAVVAGDFDSLGSTAFCDTPIAYADWNTGDYNAFAFNATGIDFVQTALDEVGGIVKLGMRNANYDVTGTPPTWSSAGFTYLGGNYAETALTTSDPKLYVEYSAAASGPANLKSLDTNLLANIKSIDTNLIANVKSIDTIT